MLSPLLYLLISRVFVLGQDLSIPTGWRSPNSSRSWNERVQIAQALLDTMIPMYDATSGRLNNLTYGQNGHMLSSIALHDLVSGNQDNNVIVSNWLGANAAALSRGSGETLSWALAAMNAYRAYGRDLFLSTATAVWNQINDGCVITADDATKGSHPIKTVTLPAQCNGTSVVGGVFLYGTNPTNLWVNVDTIGAFMTLSSLLLEATGNGTYSDSAGQSFQFIRSHLYDGNIIRDRIDLATCTQMDLQSSNSGFVIEGLSVYVNTTSNGPASDLLKDLIPSAMKFAQWTGSDGIVFENDNAFETANKGTYIRGLHEAWSRLDKNSDLAKLIQSYVIVQYNALLDLAKSPNNNFYSMSWGGPQATRLLPSGQYFAASVLNSGLAMTDNSTTGFVSTYESPLSTSEPPTSSGKPTPTMDISAARHHISTGLIVGATLGGLALVTILILIPLCLIRSGRKARVRSILDTRGMHPYLDRRCSARIAEGEAIPYPLLLSTMAPSGSLPFRDKAHPVLPPPANPPDHQENSEQDSIPELLNQLNRAMAHGRSMNIVTSGSTAGSSISAPPEYNHVVL